MQLPVYLYFILFSLVIAVYCYHGLKFSFLKWFIPFLLITLFTELVAVYYKYVLDQPNGWLYNIYIIFQVLFSLYMYWQLKMRKPFRQVIAACFIIYSLLSLAVYGRDGVQSLNVYMFLTGGFFVVLSGIFFLFNYFSLDNAGEEINLIPFLWITIGVLSYFSVLSITISLYKYILMYKLAIGGVELYNLVPRLMSIILYSSFAYGFWLCRKKSLR